MSAPDRDAMKQYLLSLQDEICTALEQVDGQQRFRRDHFPGERGGEARPQVLENGPHIERSAVNFSHTSGASLPKAATVRRPELVGRSFEAISLSMIVHPRNPYAPTTHMNLRLFLAEKPKSEPVWWFGGGFDLTPYYGFAEDSVHWHQQAKDACEPFGAEIYPQFKKQCDEYFYLPHRQEARGIGGVFFDDWNADGFDKSFALVKSIGDHFLPAYIPILQRRVHTEYGEREREFQLYRRGRYVEFNLIYDRGTLFGLQAGGRTESILGSMPPRVAWQYDYHPKPGTPEHALYEQYLPPRDWV